MIADNHLVHRKTIPTLLLPEPTPSDLLYLRELVDGINQRNDRFALLGELFIFESITGSSAQARWSKGYRPVFRVRVRGVKNALTRAGLS